MLKKIFNFYNYETNKFVWYLPLHNIWYYLAWVFYNKNMLKINIEESERMPKNWIKYIKLGD